MQISKEALQKYLTPCWFSGSKCQVTDRLRRTGVSATSFPSIEKNLKGALKAYSIAPELEATIY